MDGSHSARSLTRRQILKVGLLFAVTACLVTGCQQPKPPANLPRVFQQIQFDPASSGAYSIDPNSKYTTYEKELSGHLGQMPRMDHRDYAMLAGNRAMILDALGRTDAARQAALDSQAIMTGQVRGEEGKAVAASLGDEGAKVFKGECYEIAMLNCFIGICNLKSGDSETAAIGFRRALERDKMSKEGFRTDFGLAYWGLGMSMLDSDVDTAGEMLRRCGYKTANEVAGENAVFLIYLGRAPWKRLTGMYGEFDVITMSSYEPRSAEVFIDGKSIGKSFKLIDLYEQSKGVPRTGKDVGQGVKATGKAVLAITAGAFLGSSAQDLIESGWAVKADMRACYMLPNEVHVVSAALSPGSHTVRAKFYNVGGAELRRYEQIWHGVRIPKDGRRIISLRSEFDRCNVQGPIPFTRVNKVTSRKITPPDKSSDGSAPPEPKEIVTISFRATNLPVKVGDTVKICHFYGHTELRMDTSYHWRYEPMKYNGKGEPIGHPNNRLRMQDYDVGLIGLAKVTEIEGERGRAEIVSLTSQYKPNVDDMVTATSRHGRLWR